ncbi:SDR family NAD(P)-dependent oxidoreductase [Paracoccus chinensis]|uniref:3-hydroxybutyrate dehydrogenase n=1 Tax=Paracoccus chinensis TaxID=525640 RepID=A0A1G9JY50_9RHOB|nr:SDR family NAD(P)-dependent oxidoreductase [Paracoccus chinensis]SDL42104.1 3-hydroxybutyrate dehydrogenase [Paracoccus chinensis]
MTDLTGKAALVTGSVQGIGLEIARALAGAGAAIAVHGLADASQAEAPCEALRAAGAPEARFFDHDLSDPEGAGALVREAAAWRDIDILVNNAGIQHTASLADMPLATFQRILNINLTAAFVTMQAALPAMAERGYGRVINIASVHGLVASVQKAPYVASKFGLVGMSRVAALEYAAAGSRETGGVTVNCICPGWTETANIEPQIAARAAAHKGDRAAGIADLLSEKQPSRRTSDPAELGALALWLCHPIAHNLTGAAIPVDGGWTAQ